MSIANGYTPFLKLKANEIGALATLAYALKTIPLYTTPAKSPQEKFEGKRWAGQALNLRR